MGVFIFFFLCETQKNHVHVIRFVYGFVIYTIVNKSLFLLHNGQFYTHKSDSIENATEKKEIKIPNSVCAEKKTTASIGWQIFFRA